MEKINYQQTYQKLTKDLSPKTKDIFDRRFGVGAPSGSGQPETLEAIGKSFKITRERVRQIEAAGFSSIKKQKKEILDNVYKNFAVYFNKNGGLKRETLVLEQVGGKNAKPYILFLLTLGEQFFRICEKADFYYFWSTIPSAQNKVKETLVSLTQDMQKLGKPVSKKEFCANFSSKYGFSEQAMLSYLEVSKVIQENKEGKIGLTDWPEIRPRGVKDKAFLVFKKQGKPLHFVKVAELIDKLECNLSNLPAGKQGKKTFPQTVHNELIKDSRFVLVGRGTYALQEWGYQPGTIKDIIVKILKENKEPVYKDNLVKEVLSQRLVAKNTVLMNLNNKKHFSKDENGRYFLKGTQTA